MLISPEEYYARELKGRSAAEIEEEIRRLKREIGKLKKAVEAPDYDAAAHVRPDERTQLKYMSLYLERAAAARRDFDGGADMMMEKKTSAGQTSNKKPTKLHVRKPLCETFTFTDELTHHHKADAYKAYNSANENVGYVFMTDDQRTPAYGHCELHFYPDYQDRYQEWRRMTSNGERIKWETLCEKLKAEGRCEYFVD